MHDRWMLVSYLVTIMWWEENIKHKEKGGPKWEKEYDTEPILNRSIFQDFMFHIS